MSLQQQTWRRMGWVGALQVVLSILQTGSNILLARVLFPADFGIIALAQTFIYFVNRFQDFGLGTAIIQKQGEVQHLLYTANLFRSIVAAALVVVCWGLGPLWASFYGEASVAHVIRLLALAYILNSAVFIPRTLLKKAMAFRRIFLIESSGAALNSVLKIVLALTGSGFWCIPIGALAGQATATVLYHFAHPHPFRLTWNRAAVVELFRFTRFLILAGLITFLNTNLDNMSVGKVIGIAALGYFDIAYRWGTWLTQQLTQMVTRVFLPTLASIQSDLPRLRRALLKSNEVLVAVAAPLFLGLSAVAPEFVATLLGPKWLPSVAALRIAAFCGLFRTLTRVPGTLLVSVARVRWPAVISTATLLATVATIVPLTIAFEIEGAALAIGLAAYTGMVVALYAALREVRLGAWEYFRTVLPSLASSVLMAACVVLLAGRLPLDSPPLRLLALTAAGVVLYSVLLCLLSRRTPQAWWRRIWPRAEGQAAEDAVVESARDQTDERPL